MRTAPLIAALLTLAAAPAAAQALGSSALKNHDSNAPIDIDAERIEVLDLERQAVFSGDVKVRQASMKLDAARMRVFYERAGGGNLSVQRLDADGGLRLESPSETATSRFGIYDVGKRTLTMIGGVVLNRGESVLRGERLTIDLASGRSTLDGSSSGTPAQGKTRVSGRFVVPPRNN